jgi:hypothetical protein
MHYIYRHLTNKGQGQITTRTKNQWYPWMLMLNRFITHLHVLKLTQISSRKELELRQIKYTNHRNIHLISATVASLNRQTSKNSRIIIIHDHGEGKRVSRLPIHISIFKLHSTNSTIYSAKHYKTMF